MTLRIFVIEPLGQGGLIHYSFHMCRALQRAGAQVTLVTSTEYELDHLKHEFRLEKRMRLWNARQRSGAGKLERLIRRGLRGVRYIVEWLRLLNYLRQQKPDVILFGEIRFGFELYFLRWLKGRGFRLADVVHDVRMYDTSRGSDTILKEDAAHLARYNEIYNQFDALFVHDRINYDLFLELYDVPAERVTEIPHGTNEIMLEMQPSHSAAQLRELYQLQPDEQVVTFFGTLTKYKGIEDLVRAYPAIQRETGARLVIAGFPAKDVDPEELRAIARADGMEDKIVWFLDYVPNEQVVPLMQISDVIAMPYRAITSSGVLQIAGACGKPVVATHVGGLPDVIEDGKSGLLVEPESPAQLAAAINRILRDASLRASMGARARELAETRYSWRYVADRVLSALGKAEGR